MASNVPSVVGGGKYKPYIEDLVRIAEEKRKPFEARLERSQLEKSILVENRSDIPILKNSIAQLFGLESVFQKNSVHSSDPMVVTAEAQKNAKPIEIKLEVRQIASADRFYSKELSKDFSVPAGDYQFFVGDEKIALAFQGGDLTSFATQLSDISPEYLKAKVMPSSTDKQILLLESQKTGAQNRLNFQKAAKDFAFKVELITRKINTEYIVTSDTGGLKQGISIDPKADLSLNPGRLLDLKVQSTAPLKLKPGAYLSLEYTKKIEEAQVVHYPAHVAHINKAQALKEGNLIPLQDDGPVHLPRVADTADVYLIIDGQAIPMTPLAEKDDFTKIKWDLSEYQGEVQGLVLRNQRLIQNIRIKNLEFSTPSDIDFTPMHAASVARDAEFTLDGVLVKRPTNHIEDVTPEMELNLLSSNPKPVTLSVQPDFDTAEKAIKEFITVYNYYIMKLNIATSHKGNTMLLDEINFESEEAREAAEKKLGVYQGDSQFIQLKNSLFTFMIQPYKVGDKRKDSMILRDMGISTNNNTLGGGLGDSSTRRGYFQVDDKKLRAALEAQWPQVRDFFASRTSNEKILADDGLAVKLTEYLKAFEGRDGMVSKRIDTLDKRIEREEKQIDDFNEKLKAQRKKWEADFAKAEAAEAEMERLQKQMDGYFPSNK